MESDYDWLVTVALVASSVIAVTANSFLLAVFCRRRGLRTVPNRFVINLLITNLLSSILLIPLLLMNQETTAIQTEGSNNTLQLVITEEILTATQSDGSGDLEIIQTDEKVLERQPTNSQNHTDRLLLCYFAQGSTSFMCTLSIFSILLIGVNQYFGVIHSLRYHVYINRCRSTIFIATTWVAAFFCAILSSLTFSDSTLWHFCEKPPPSSDSSRIFATVYAFLYFILIILAPFVAICVIYVCIYTAAHQNSERMRKSNSACSTAPLEYTQVPLEQRAREEGLPKVRSAPNFSQLQTSYVEVTCQNVVQVKRTSSERSTNNFITNLKHKLSNASVFRYREETRAAKISILVIFTVLVCYIPYGLTLVLSSDCIGIHPGQVFNYLSLVLLVISNIISPFLFGYRNKRVKREIGKMFGLVTSSGKIANPERCKRANRSFEDINENNEPFLGVQADIPKVIVTCKTENEKERKSILKMVCNSSAWASYKKCNFITVPDSCLGEARGSFSSASTQISTEE